MYKLLPRFSPWPAEGGWFGIHQYPSVAANSRRCTTIPALQHLNQEILPARRVYQIGLGTAIVTVSMVISCPLLSWCFFPLAPKPKVRGSISRKWSQPEETRRRRSGDEKRQRERERENKRSLRRRRAQESHTRIKWSWHQERGDDDGETCQHIGIGCCWMWGALLFVLSPPIKAGYEWGTHLPADARCKSRAFLPCPPFPPSISSSSFFPLCFSHINSRHRQKGMVGGKKREGFTSTSTCGPSIRSHRTTYFTHGQGQRAEPGKFSDHGSY